MCKTQMEGGYLFCFGSVHIICILCCEDMDVGDLPRFRSYFSTHDLVCLL